MKEVILTIYGVRKPLRKWAKEAGVEPQSLYARLSTLRKTLKDDTLQFKDLTNRQLQNLVRGKEHHNLDQLNNQDGSRAISITDVAKVIHLSRQAVYFRLDKVKKGTKTIREAIYPYFELVEMTFQDFDSAPKIDTKAHKHWIKLNVE